MSVTITPELSVAVVQLVNHYNEWAGTLTGKDSDLANAAAYNAVKGDIEAIWALKPAEACTKIPCSHCGCCLEPNEIHWHEEYGGDDLPLCEMCAEEVKETE